MMKIKGAKRLKKNIKALAPGNRNTPTMYKDALLKLLLRVERDAVLLTPVDTGKLRNSGTGNSKVSSFNDIGAKGSLRYTANYATYVHEITTNKHVVGQSKFLEKAILDVAPEVPYILGGSIMDDINGIMK